MLLTAEREGNFRPEISDFKARKKDQKHPQLNRRPQRERRGHQKSRKNPGDIDPRISEITRIGGRARARLKITRRNCLWRFRLRNSHCTHGLEFRLASHCKVFCSPKMRSRSQKAAMSSGEAVWNQSSM